MESKKINQKFISFVLIFIFILAPMLSTKTNAQITGYPTNFTTAAHVLICLNIISEDDVSTNNIMREEFALFIARLTSAVPEYFIDDPFATCSYFTDVTDSRYITAINYCAENGIMSGIGNGLFNPTGTVTLQEAIKMLVTALGYTGLSYPIGYLSTANASDVRLIGTYAEFSFSGVSAIATLTKNDYIMLLYNFLLSNYNKLQMVFNAVDGRYESQNVQTPVLDSFGITNINDYIASTVELKFTVYGDVNGDGKITALDATLILRYIVGLNTFSETQKSAADVSNDGKITALDATLILRYIVGLNDKLGP